MKPTERKRQENNTREHIYAASQESRRDWNRVRGEIELGGLDYKGKGEEHMRIRFLYGKDNYRGGINLTKEWPLPCGSKRSRMSFDGEIGR